MSLQSHLGNGASLSGTAGRFNGRPARDGSRSPRRARTGSAARLGVEERRFDEHRSGATRRTMLSGRGYAERLRGVPGWTYVQESLDMSLVETKSLRVS